MRDIVVDCRVLQTAAWSRGMGRYLLCLLEQIEKANGASRLVLVFSSNLENDTEQLETVKRLVPSASLLHLPLPNGGSTETERTSSRILDDCIVREALNNPVFISGSIFTFDYQPFLSTIATNTIIFYDLIPLKRWHEFHAYFPEAEYSRRFKFVYEADHIFAISREVEEDLQTYLSVDPSRITNIKGASIPEFDSNKKLSKKQEDAINLPERFIMLPGGDSPHKNMFHAVAAFDKMNATFGDTFKLVVTSKYSPKSQEIMQALSPNVVLTGVVSDEELKAYYRHADVMLFPSLDEGLGLPLLETVDFGGTVACSDIPVFKEITNDAFYFFDPMSVNDMAHTLVQAVIDKKSKSRKEQYEKIKDNFTWRNSAEILVRKLDDIVSHENNAHDRVAAVIEQAYTVEENHTIGALISKYGIDNVELYMDQIGLLEKESNSIPLLAVHFLRTRDIVDLKSSWKHRAPKQKVYLQTAKSTELSEKVSTRYPGNVLRLHSGKKSESNDWGSSNVIDSIDEIEAR